MYKLHKTFCTCCSKLIIVDKIFTGGFDQGTEVADVSVTYFSNSPTNIQNSCGYYTQVCQPSGGQYNINHNFILQSCYDNVQPQEIGQDPCNASAGHDYIKIVGNPCGDQSDVSLISLDYKFDFLTGGNEFDPGGCGGVCYSEYESNPWTDAMSIRFPCNSGYSVNIAKITVIVNTDGSLEYGYIPVQTGPNEISYEYNIGQCCYPTCIELQDGSRYAVECSGFANDPCSPSTCQCNPPNGDIGPMGIAITKLCQPSTFGTIGTKSCTLIVPGFGIADGIVTPLFGGTVNDFVNAINQELNDQKIFAQSLTAEPYWIGSKSRGSESDPCSCFNLGQPDQFRFKLDENGNPIIIQEDNSYKYIIQARYSTYFSLQGVSAVASRACIPKEQGCEGVIFDPNTNEPIFVPEGCCCEFDPSSGWFCLDHQTCQSSGSPIAIAGGSNDFTCFPSCYFIPEENLVIPSECISDNIPKNDPDNPDVGCCTLDPYDYSDPDPNNWEQNICGNQLGILVWEKRGAGIKGRFGTIITNLYNTENEVNGQIIIS